MRRKASNIAKILVKVASSGYDRVRRGAAVLEGGATIERP